MIYINKQLLAQVLADNKQQSPNLGPAVESYTNLLG